MLWSRITAILLVVGAIVWIASGALTKKEAPPANTKVVETKPFQVSVLSALLNRVRASLLCRAAPKRMSAQWRLLARAAL